MKNHTTAEKAKLVSQVDQLRRDQKLSIKKACKEVGISDPSYYKWKQESLCQGETKNESKAKEETIPKGVVASKIKSEDQDKILEIKASFPYMGVKQLRQHLIRNHKLKYSERQIRQLLETNKVPKIKSSFAPQPVRRFERDLPNEMWQTDLMNFHIGLESCYLVSFLDDHSRFIVSYSISDHSGSQVVLDLLRRAVSFRKPLSIITDRGIQFCSWNGVTAFQMELKSLKIDHLLAREQHPETMGKIEAFHKTIKRELLTTVEFSDIEEAKETIHDYIMFYNFAIPHMGIGHKSPAELYFKNLRAYNHQSIYHRRITPGPGNSNEQKEEKPKEIRQSIKTNNRPTESRKSKTKKTKRTSTSSFGNN